MQGMQGGLGFVVELAPSLTCRVCGTTAQEKAEERCHWHCRELKVSLGRAGGSKGYAGREKQTWGPGQQETPPSVPCWSCRQWQKQEVAVRVPAREQGQAAACSLGTCGQAASPASSDLSHLLFPYLHTQQFLKCLHNCVHRVSAFLPFSNSIAYFSQLRCCLITGTLQ